MDIEKYSKELKDLLIDLCKIPAPTGDEDERINFIANWYIDNGCLSFEIDSAGNLLYFFGVKAYNPIHLYTAHVDTVFTRETILKPTIEDDVLYCPGAGDNTANVAIMMMTVKYLTEIGYEPPVGVIFAADIGEEGLGNLRGMRSIMSDYGVRIEEVVSLDLAYGTIINHAIGSKRYEVEISSKGGHAFHDFGNPNSIAIASKIISKFYEMNITEDSNTTYNVGKIDGGTSINVIAPQTKFLFEVRSNKNEKIEEISESFLQIIESEKVPGVTIETKLVGERPGMGKVNETKMQFLLDRVYSAYNSAGYKEAGYGDDYTLTPGSTDCNISLSKGIPSICFGLAYSEGHHSLNEMVRIDSLALGLKALLIFILN